MLSPPDNRTGAGSQEGAAYSLAVRIEDGSGAERTAYPTTTAERPDTYTVRVVKDSDGTVLGSTRFSWTASGSQPVLLSEAAVAGDWVIAEGFRAGVKIAEGSAALASNHVALPFDAVTVTVHRSSDGLGRVKLSINFPRDAAEITAAEITLYASLADYQEGSASWFKRYRRDEYHGQGEELNSSISLPESLPSGNYVARVEFFRGRFISVKTIIQTILVRDGLITEKWDGASGPLNLTEDDFASSNAALAGISIGGTSVPDFHPEGHSYSITEAAASAGTPALSITAAKAGQSIEAKLNDTALSLSKSGLVFSHSSLPLTLGTNSLSIIVTAPDGVTKQSYTVSYTYYHTTQWYVAASDYDFSPGSDTTGDGTEPLPFATVGRALDAIKAPTAYNGGSGWPGGNSTPVPVLIEIRGSVEDTGNINGKVEISDTALYATLPPIILAGPGWGDDHKIDAGDSGRALYIDKAHVILGNNLTITGGNITATGGGVSVTNGRFTMNGGTISGNTVNTNNGGGVYIGANGSFTMNGGTIEENTAGHAGGVSVTNGGSFTMNGGSIGGNIASTDGGGVSVGGSLTPSSFTMNGGTISGNTVNSNYGGGVYIGAFGSFIMNGGSVSENTINSSYGSGGGVSVNSGSASFTMNGGSVSGNTASNGGGVNVYTGSFIMNGGSVSGNTASNGGGVYVTSSNSSFTMYGGSLSGNSAAAFGGGVYVTGSNNSFTMEGGSLSGNSAGTHGGGVYVNGSNNSFTMEGGSLSGNSAGSGGAVYVNLGVFTMNEGSLGGNTAGNGGGGVYVTGASGSFALSGGGIGGNTASSSGGGVYISGGSFTMSNGSIGGNTASGGYIAGGGGVYVSGGSFTMNGGSVGRNTASSGHETGGGGVYVTGASGSFTISGGSVGGNTAGYYGGGVYVISDASFTMTGGSVDGNTAGNGGGGVYIYYGGVFDMSEGSIGGNTAGYGGGAYFEGSTFTLSGGSINGNIANSSGYDRGGGGVYFGGMASATPIMSGGSINGNTANSGGGVHFGYGRDFIMSGGSINGNTAITFGGGVCSGVNTGVFTMSGGSIGGNTAGSGGGGVYVADNLTFIMSGSALVDRGNTVYLDSGKTITLSGPLSANPAANIQPADTAPGTPLLADDIAAGSPPNHERFLVNNEAGKIDSSGKYSE